MKRKTFVPDAEPAPVRLRDGGFAFGLLQGIETVEDELVAVLERMAVLVPPELEDKLKELVGKPIIVGYVDGKWGVAVQNKCLRPVGWREKC